MGNTRDAPEAKLRPAERARSCLPFLACAPSKVDDFGRVLTPEDMSCCVRCSKLWRELPAVGEVAPVLKLLNLTLRVKAETALMTWWTGMMGLFSRSIICFAKY